MKVTQKRSWGLNQAQVTKPRPTCLLRVSPASLLPRVPIILSGPHASSFTPEPLCSAHSPVSALTWVSFSLILVRAPVDDHGGFQPALRITRATFSSIAGSWLPLSGFRGQEGAGVLTVAHDLHLDVAEVRQALVVGSCLPQPDVGGLGAEWGCRRQQERE